METRSQTPIEDQKRLFDASYKAAMVAAMEAAERDPRIAMDALLFAAGSFATMVDVSEDSFIGSLEYALERFRRARLDRAERRERDFRS